MATMKLIAPNGHPWEIVLGAGWEAVKAAGAIDWMSACHPGFRTEGLAIGYIKRLMRTWGGTSAVWYVPVIPTVNPDGSPKGRVYGVYIAKG